jgi:hypothetical protein
MAVAMREAAGTLIADWRERGRDLGYWPPNRFWIDGRYRPHCRQSAR